MDMEMDVEMDMDMPPERTITNPYTASCLADLNVHLSNQEISFMLPPHLCHACLSVSRHVLHSFV